MLLPSLLRTLFMHLAVKLRIRHVCTWRAQCLTYVGLINSFLLLLLSLLSFPVCVSVPCSLFLSLARSLSLSLLNCILRQSVCFSSALSARVQALVQAQTHLLLVFPFWECFFCCHCNWMNFSTRLIRHKLRNAITQALFALSLSLSLSISLLHSQHTLPQSASACTLIIVNRQPIGSQQLLPVQSQSQYQSQFQFPVPVPVSNSNPRPISIPVASPSAGSICQLACGFC